ncbi:MAG: C-GCAxxG-C-C family protein [Bacteroidales bacterium]|jgi:C_GCAxxG_C_C family probable redox protein|nr:C-GCAxxG-C-C family protein [Bacteroidales bacterium]
MTEDQLLPRITKAKELFAGPYNCAQSVAAAYADILGMDDNEIFRLMSGFGFGMGGERSVCGAVSGGIFVLSSSIKDPAQREELYDKVYYLISRFKNQNQGSLNCIDLVGENPANEDFQSRCPLLIEQVVSEVGKILNPKF